MITFPPSEAVSVAAVPDCSLLARMERYHASLAPQQRTDRRDSDDGDFDREAWEQAYVLLEIGRPVIGRRCNSCGAFSEVDRLSEHLARCPNCQALLPRSTMGLLDAWREALMATDSERAQGNHHDDTGPPAEPTDAAPGTERKVEDMVRRASRREELWHECDMPMHSPNMERIPVLADGNYKVLMWTIFRRPRS